MGAVKTWGVTLQDSALVFSTAGATAGKWLQQTASDVWGGIKKGIKAALDLANRMLEGGKELLAAIFRGDLGIFMDWLKNDPLGLLAGGAALAVGGWFIGAATGVGAAVAGAVSSITAVASSGIGGMWAAICGIKFGGVALGAMLPTLQQAIVGGTTTLMNLDWQQSDKSILDELNGVYNSFLNSVGESAGRMLAGFILGGGKANPKLRINVSAGVALAIQAEAEGSAIEEELIEELANLANTFIRYATNLAGKLGYLQLRKWARQNVRTGIKAIDAKIANWGLVEGESFVINTVIDEKIEKITEENASLGNLLEGFKEGLFDGFSDFVMMT